VAQLCQRTIEWSREVLGQLATRHELLELGGGAGRGRYYRLSRTAYDLLVGSVEYHVDRRLARENVKARILAVLKERPLTNAQVREIGQLDRSQALQIMRSLKSEGAVVLDGTGRGSRWKLAPKWRRKR